jgi:hypothetical protein
MVLSIGLLVLELRQHTLSGAIDVEGSVNQPERGY